MSNKEHEKYPYLLKGLKISHKNQMWAKDTTSIPITKGFMYLTAIIDLYTKFVLN
jgi:putative transposase